MTASGPAKHPTTDVTILKGSIQENDKLQLCLTLVYLSSLLFHVSNARSEVPHSWTQYWRTIHIGAASFQACRTHGWASEINTGKLKYGLLTVVSGAARRALVYWTRRKPSLPDESKSGQNRSVVACSVRRGQLWNSAEGSVTKHQMTNFAIALSVFLRWHQWLSTVTLLTFSVCSGQICELHNNTSHIASQRYKPFLLPTSLPSVVSIGDWDFVKRRIRQTIAPDSSIMGQFRETESNEIIFFHFDLWVWRKHNMWQSRNICCVLPNSVQKGLLICLSNVDGNSNDSVLLSS